MSFHFRISWQLDIQFYLLVVRRSANRINLNEHAFVLLRFAPSFVFVALPDQVGECDPGNGRIPGANSYKEGLLSLQGTSMVRDPNVTSHCIK